jgi:membrane protease YdiL (CAAX protease family)
LLFFLVNGAGVVAARRLGRPPASFAAYTDLALAILLAIIVSRMHWWGHIGFRRAQRPASLILFLPAFALAIGNLTFGIHVTQLRELLAASVLAATSGFAEEVAFRGLMLRALLRRGEWTAVLVTAALFGLAHGGNVLAGFNPLYVVVQIAYALAVGFGWSAMALRGGLLWPLVVAHALGNFVAFINGDAGQVVGGRVSSHLLVVSLAYIVLFTAYGLVLMRREGNVMDPKEA